MPRDINERLIMKTKRSVCVGPNGEELWAVINVKGKRIGGMWYGGEAMLVKIDTSLHKIE